MSLTCRQLAELLIDYVSGELPPEQEERLRQHLDACPPCVVYLQTYQVTIKLTRQLPCQQLPEGLKRRLEDALGGYYCPKRGEPPPEQPGATV